MLTKSENQMNHRDRQAFIKNYNLCAASAEV